MKVLRRVVIGWFVFIAAVTAAAFTVRRFVVEYGDEGDSELSVVAVMDGRDISISAADFRRATVLAFMGGVAIDMTSASLAGGATLELKAVMGGIDIIVPDDWRVEVVSRSVMGSVDDQTGPDSGSDDERLLVVKATTLMGGVSIREAEAG